MILFYETTSSLNERQFFIVVDAVMLLAVLVSRQIYINGVLPRLVKRINYKTIPSRFRARGGKRKHATGSKMIFDEAARRNERD